MSPASSNVNTWMCRMAVGLPVAEMPWKGPSWVPLMTPMQTTVSASATILSSSKDMSELPSHSRLKTRLAPSGPAGVPGRALWLMKPGAKNASHSRRSCALNSSRQNSRPRVLWSGVDPLNLLIER
jgi:hypothetical protein